MLKRLVTFTAAALLACAASAGNSFGFASITNNKAANAATGAAQFSVALKDAGPGSVAFLFTNTGPNPSSMVQLYWDDFSSALVLTSLDAWSTTTPSKSTPNFGVNYSGSTAVPFDLPAGKANGFFPDYSIQPTSKGGKTKNGVGTGEDVSVFFSHSGSYQDVVDAINKGKLKVGIHAQSFKGGGSESFVSVPNPTPPTGIPTPTAALAGIAMLGVAGLRRRRA